MPTTYKPGDRVIVRNRGATWPGTVEGDGPRTDGPPRYRVRVSPYTVGDFGADMLAPEAPAPEREEAR